MQTRLLLTALLLILPAANLRADWLDFLKKATTSTNATASLTALTETEIANGLKEALAKGVAQAVAQLGKDGGFLKNLDVKIPIPEKLRSVEKGLRAMGQDKYADEFDASLNHAAEQAVPAAAAVFADAIKQMTVNDAQAILKGPPDAATQYFRKTSTTQLTEKFLPIVKTATEKTGVTAAYKQLIQKAGPMAQLLGQDNADLDSYVTKKALDGLFKMVAAEEKQIRENPVARTTDLLKKVSPPASSRQSQPQPRKLLDRRVTLAHQPPEMLDHSRLHSGIVHRLLLPRIGLQIVQQILPHIGMLDPRLTGGDAHRPTTFRETKRLRQLDLPGQLIHPKRPAHPRRHVGVLVKRLIILANSRVHVHIPAIGHIHLRPVQPKNPSLAHRPVTRNHLAQRPPRHILCRR